MPFVSRTFRLNNSSLLFLGELPEFHTNIHSVIKIPTAKRHSYSKKSVYFFNGGPLIEGM